MHKVLELVANERMSQGKRGEKLQRKDESKRMFPIEEMKEKPHIAVEEVTEEMTKWRGLSQSDKD